MITFAEPPNFVIEPHKGVGPVQFGMHKDEVTHLFTYVYRSFFKGKNSKVRSDHIEVVGLIIHYDDQGRVNYIEVTKPVHGKVTLELFGQDITDISARDLADLLRNNSLEVKQDAYRCDCPSLGLSTYNDDPRSKDARIDCIGLSRQDYAEE